MNAIIGLKELRQNTAHYIKETKRGKSFLVLQRSRPIFRVVPVDEWGDEGTWETIIDFTKIKKGGVPTDEILKAIDRVQRKNESHRQISSKA